MNSNKLVQATFGLPLSDALNITNIVTTSGDGGWFGQTNVTHDGQAAARTAPILLHTPTASSSSLQTTVTLAHDGTVSFWWRSDSPGNTIFVIDNNRVFVALRSLSGVTPWAQKTSFLPAGTHTLSWTYTHGSDRSELPEYSVTPLDAVFLDEVVVREYANTNEDLDADGLPDLWEYKYFDTLAYGAADDPDNDGVSNLSEWQDGTIPTSGSSVYPRLTYITEGGGNLTASPPLAKYTYGQTITNSAAPVSGWDFFTWLGPFLTQTSITPKTNNPAAATLYRSQTIWGIFELPLAQVTDSPGFTWTGGGDLGWYGQTNFSRDGVSAAQSGPVGFTGQSWMETTVQGPGTLTFWWKVDSSTNADVLYFLLNSNVQLPAVSGVVDWQQQTLLLGNGPQTLRWLFARGHGTDTNRLAAAWVDQVQYLTGPTPPQFVQQPSSQTVLGTSNAFIQVLAQGTPPIAYQLFHGAAQYGTPTTNSTLVISNVQAAFAGSWSVQASNQYNTAMSSPFTLNVLPVPPLNDPFAGRFTFVGLSNAVTAYNFGATFEPGESGVQTGYGGASVWWSWMAPQSGTYRGVALATNSGNYLVLGVYSGSSVSSLTLIGSGFGASVSTNAQTVDQAEAFFNAVGGAQYAVSVDTEVGIGEWFSLWMEFIPTPGNDLFANRFPLSGDSASGISQNASATIEPGEPSPYLGAPPTNSVWWTWTAPRSGPARVSSLGSSFLPIIAVYTGNVLSSLTKIGSAAGGGPLGETVLDFNAVAGTAYQIAVDSFSGVGNIHVNVALNIPSFGSATFSQGSIGFSIQGPAGASYVVEQSADLQAWTSLTNGVLSVNGTATFQDAVKPGLVGRFYRIRLN
jgi:hypothetical protein